jgi:hypothetical protein
MSELPASAPLFPKCQLVYLQTVSEKPDREDR